MHYLSTEEREYVSDVFTSEGMKEIDEFFATTPMSQVQVDEICVEILIIAAEARMQRKHDRSKKIGIASMVVGALGAIVCAGLI